MNGTEDLDETLERLARVLAVVREEQWSVDYTRAHAPSVGSLILDRLPESELENFADDIENSTEEAKDNIDRILDIIGMSAEIAEHYKKLAEIGTVWNMRALKDKDLLRHYQ
jgi:hypothetical protein